MAVERIGSDQYPFFAARLPLGTGDVVERVKALSTVAAPDWYWMPQDDHIRVAFRHETDAVAFDAANGDPK